MTATTERPPLIAFVIAVAAIYFGKDILIPLGLAVLISFLLTPAVRRLEIWKLGRIPSVVFVMSITVAATAGIGWIVTNQLLDVINQLPNYKSNIVHKLESFRGPQGSSLAKATASVQELGKELSTRPAQQETPELPRQPARTQLQAPQPEVGKTPVPVELVQPPPTALQNLRDLLGPLVGPAGAAVIVVVFALVMLIRREDLRSRILRLIGLGRITLATEAFDDATERVSRYLRTQFLVNTVFGTVIFLGLHFIGVQGAALWGVLAGLFRFVPYIGPLIGGGLPFLLSLAVFAGWRQPLMTLGLFMVAEFTVAYVIEPWLYGKHTGISSLAILVAAAFWAALWGPVGLILSTPLTVCLVVLGRYVPQFEFLYVLLGDEPVLTPEVQLYQRLLALDQHEAHAVIDEFLKEKSVAELYDSVLIPALALGEADRHKGKLDKVREDFLVQSVSEFVVELADYADAQRLFPDVSTATAPPGHVVCLPAKDRADELTAAMLAQMLESIQIQAVCMPPGEPPVEVLDELCTGPHDVICISALPPFAVLNARSLSKKLSARLPHVKILVGLWNSGGDQAAEKRIDKIVSGDVVTTLAQAVEQIGKMAGSRPLDERPEPVADPG